jgi:hypothetical protein
MLHVQYSILPFGHLSDFSGHGCWFAFLDGAVEHGFYEGNSIFG